MGRSSGNAAKQIAITDFPCRGEYIFRSHAVTPDGSCHELSSGRITTFFIPNHGTEFCSKENTLVIIETHPSASIPVAALANHTPLFDVEFFVPEAELRATKESGDTR